MPINGAEKKRKRKEKKKKKMMMKKTQRIKMKKKQAEKKKKDKKRKKLFFTKESTAGFLYQHNNLHTRLLSCNPQNRSATAVILNSQFCLKNIFQAIAKAFGQANGTWVGKAIRL